jgi:hypothetical protein
MVLLAITAMTPPTRAGCDDRSDASNARLKIKWRVDTEVAPDAGRADPSTIDPSEWAEQPMMIYIPSDDPTDSITRKLEKVVFPNEKVAIGAKFFDTIKISARDALDDRLLTEHAEVTPQIVFLKRDYTEHAALQQKQISASKLLKAMRSVAREEYVNDFDTMIRTYSRLLDELDRLEAKREALAKQRKRLEAQPNAAKIRQLERDEEAYDAAMEAWLEKEEKLLALRPKGAKKAGA